MAHVVEDRVLDTASTTGTGNFTVDNSPPTGFRTLNSVLSTSDTFPYAIVHRTLNEWETGIGTYSGAHVFVRTTVLKSTNSNNAVNFSAGVKDVHINVGADVVPHMGPIVLPKRLPQGFDMPINLGLSAAVGANALTISVVAADGNSASATNPIHIPFRSATASTGTPVWRTLSAASSLTISSGSTLGATSAVPFRTWVVMFDDAGTLRLGVIQRITGGLTPTAEAAVADYMLASSTAEGGAGAADSAGTFYTGTAVASKALRILGYLDWNSGLTTAGTWDAAPSVIQLFGPGVPHPGAVIQHAITTLGTSSTGTTGIPVDDTKPQNTEGDEYVTTAITPTSNANILRAWSQIIIASSSSGFVACCMFRDSVADAMAATWEYMPAAATYASLQMDHRRVANGTSAVTFKMRAGVNSGSGSTLTVNGVSGTQYFGGVFNSFLAVEERMA